VDIRAAADDSLLFVYRLGQVILEDGWQLRSSQERETEGRPPCSELDPYERERSLSTLSPSSWISARTVELEATVGRYKASQLG